MLYAMSSRMHVQMTQTATVGPHLVSVDTRWAGSGPTLLVSKDIFTYLLLVLWNLDYVKQSDSEIC